ncbi:unnamed protein product [Ostreobium quekettii]|uniref:Ankyrin repeat protein n=1 Tax=Ostreobium quekettii TaxID=121088 RepID=A0A8S1IJY1_9CHLO|nr:unnamed protein product [Ostreobium quekettii]
MPVVKLLLEKGANISARNKEGNTPMMYAAGHGHTPVVDKLLDFGAPLDLVDENGDTVLHHAAKWGQMPVVKLLLEKGADTSIRNKEGVPHGYTAATLAEKHDHPEIANFIKNWENPN